MTERDLKEEIKGYGNIYSLRLHPLYAELLLSLTSPFFISAASQGTFSRRPFDATTFFPPSTLPPTTSDPPA
jgi:hypothetical protein